VKTSLCFCKTSTNHSFCCSDNSWLIFKVFLGSTSIVSIGYPWYFYGGYMCFTGEMLVKDR
jgi:hypothetical protein